MANNTTFYHVALYQLTTMILPFPITLSIGDPFSHYNLGRCGETSEVVIYHWDYTIHCMTWGKSFVIYKSEAPWLEQKACVFRHQAPDFLESGPEVAQRVLH